MLLLSWRPVKWLSSSSLPFVLTSAAVPTHWHHRPTVWPICQHCGVKESGGNADVRFWRREENTMRRTKSRSPFSPVEDKDFHFTGLHATILRENCLESSGWGNTELAHLKSQDYVLLDACRVPRHAHRYPSNTYTLSCCMLLTNWFGLVFSVFLLTEIYLMFDVNGFQSSWLAV